MDEEVDDDDDGNDVDDTPVKGKLGNKTILETADRADESVIPKVITLILLMRRLRISHYYEAGHL